MPRDLDMVEWYRSQLTKIQTKVKNPKVFEQKGNLLSFKVNIDPKLGLMLSWAEHRQTRLNWVEQSQAEPSWAKLNICDEFGQFFKLLLFFSTNLITLTSRRDQEGDFRKCEIALKSYNIDLISLIFSVDSFRFSI